MNLNCHLKICTYTHFFPQDLFFQVNLQRSSALQKIHSEFQELPVCQTTLWQEEFSRDLCQVLTPKALNANDMHYHPEPKVMEGRAVKPAWIWDA